MLTLAFASGGAAPRTDEGRGVGVWRDDRGCALAQIYVSPERRWIDWPSLGVFAFSPGCRTVDVWPSEGVPREVVTRAFVRMLEPIVLQALGWQALHASAVLGPAGVLAFCGRSGSGKSTLAYALGQRHHGQFADDGLTLELVSGQVLGHAMSFVPRLTASSHAFFGHADNQARDHSTSAVPPGTLAPMAGIFLLARTPDLSGPPVIRSLAPTRAFAAVLSHAHCFDGTDPEETQRLIADYLAIVERVPVYDLQYRSGFEHLAQVVDSIVRLSGSASANRRFTASQTVPVP